MSQDKFVAMFQSNNASKFQSPFLKKSVGKSKGKNVMNKLKKYVKLSKMSIMPLKNVRMFFGVKFARILPLSKGTTISGQPKSSIFMPSPMTASVFSLNPLPQNMF